jgi:amino acid adenylation domain-containing protein
MRELIGLLTKYREKGVAIVLDNSGEHIKLKGAVTSLTEEDKNELLKNKQQLLDFLRANSHSVGESIPVAEPRKEGYPLSSAQQTLWLMSQFREGNIANNVLGGYMLPGALDRECFTDAFLKVIERHEILRTVFIKAENGEIRQWVKESDELGFSIDYQDFRKEVEPMTAVSSYINEDKNRPFDLSQGPLIRAALLQVEEEQYVFCYNLHHTICDGLSMDILAKDVIAYYSAAIQGHRFSLPKLRIQYKDYASWQQEKLASKAYQVHKKYWLNQFEGDLPVLDLPTDKPRPAFKTYNGGAIKRMFSKELTRAFRNVVEAEGGTLFMGLLGLVNTLLYRYTGQVDMVLGVPVAGRDHADLQEQIGFYVNTLPLRTRLEAGDSYRSLLKRIKELTLAAYEHQAYPFDKLVDDLGLKRDMSRKPMFDVMLVLQDMEVEAAEGSTGGVNNTGMSHYQGGDHHTHSKYDLTFIFTEVADVIYLTIEYSKDLFYPESIERMGGHFEKLAESISTSPELAIAALDYLWDEEKQEVLLTFNTTETPYPNKESIVSLFEQQVASTPDQIALVVEEKYFTYRELDHRSNQLAHYLNTNYKVEKEAFIGVQLDANEWAIISLLGILKAGAAYVPIDTGYPSSRKAHIIKDTALHLLITETTYLFDLDFYEGDVLAIDVELEEDLPISAVENKPEAEHLAYVMYTSGSQGQPKGVMIEHRSVLSLVKAANYFQFSEEDNLLATGSFSFDASTFEYWGPLLNGASLVLSSRESLLKPERLKETIRKNKVNVMWFTAGWFNQLVDVDSSVFEELRTILVGGDKLSSSHIAKLQEQYEEINIINGYGPTENTTFSLTYPLPRISLSETIPIGKPISNRQCYILDESKALCPIGVWGEIYLGGDGLARAYLNSEELNREKFIEAPFEKGKRLYKTGDYGRWLADGNVAFWGRKDSQVKIRGYRIELGEIEQALLKNTLINEAVVIVRENRAAEKEVLAYLSASEELNIVEIQGALGRLLPDYMIPAHYVQLEMLPLTANGKVARELLPDPEGREILSGREYVAPRNEMEEKLLEIWKEVLQREKIGVKDDFFEQGGHSLKATVLQGEYHKQLNIKLSFIDLFTHTSIEAHANLIAQAEEQKFAIIEPAPEQESYPLSSSQKRLWVLSQFEEGNIAHNMPFYKELDGTYDIELLKKAIYSTIERHEVLRTIFHENEEGELRQWVKGIDELGFTLEYRDFSQKEEVNSAVMSYIQEDSYRPFNLSRGPLLRSAVLQTAANHYVFYYNMHHIISDGWSMEILARDVLAYYEAYQNKKEANLPSLPIQYKDYAVWQQEQLQSGVHEKDKQYWLEQFREEVAVLELPSTKVRPQMRTNSGHTLSTYIAKDLSTGLKAYSQKNGGSLFMGIVASLTAMFYRYTSQEDIIFGSPIAGREHRSLSDQIGFYVNTLVLRNKVKETDSFNELFQKVKSTTLAAYEHQAYPFDELIENLNLKQDVSRGALFDVLVVLQNNGEKQEIGELEEAVMNEIKDYGYKTSKFDLLINFEELGDYLSFSIEYNPDVYERETIKNFMHHYRQFIPELLAQQQEKLVALDYLSQQERTMLQNISRGEDHPIGEETVMSMFESMVVDYPDYPAVVDEGNTISYSELNVLSNQLAHYLRREHAVKKGERVAVMLERSKESIITLVGVMKSGACYVPVDHNYPEERISFILENAEISLVLGQSNFKDLPSLEATKFISLDSLDLSKEESSNPEAINHLADIAYVIYTSGSTGRPKGVMQTHRTLVNLINWELEASGIGGNLKRLQYVTFNFDVSLQDTWSALCSKGSLFVAEEALRLDMEALTNYIVEKQIEALSFPFSVLHHLFNEAIDLEGHSLKHIITSGEQLLVNKHLNSFLRSNPQVLLHNHYGPSETHVSTGNTVSYALNNVVVRPSVGKPIFNTGVYILDTNLKMVPIGVRGELYIDGANLAIGYLNLPEETEKRFLPHPFREGEIIYKTGDLGYWRTNGEIEYLGRKDDQVKIRGYRIELGEVERVLERYPQISSCAVLVHTNSDGEKNLLAYFVAKEKVSSIELRKELGSSLPEYMLPTYFIQLDEFPLTSNGKIDKKNLPAPEDLNLENEAKYLAPRNEVEEKVLEIWQNLMARENIGVRDNFFDIGGHSLKAIRLINSINKTFGLNYDLKQIYKEPTIELMAENISIIQGDYSMNNEELEEFRI